jgi:hypothetical protein
VANLIIRESAAEFIHALHGKPKVTISEEVDIIGKTDAGEEATKPI